MSDLVVNPDDRFSRVAAHLFSFLAKKFKHCVEIRIYGNRNPCYTMFGGRYRNFKLYALVICNHCPPTHRGGRGIALEMNGALTKVLSRQCRGNTRNWLYIGKKDRGMKT